MKPLVNSYIQKLVQTKWDVAVHGRDLYLVKPSLALPKKFQHLTRAEELVITRLRIGHTKATKSHILSRGPPTGCHQCGQTLTIDHMLLECPLLQECRDEYYTVDSLNALFETIPETCIVEFLREAGFFYLIWCNLLTSISHQTWTIWSDLSNCLENESNSETYLITCVGRLIHPEGRVPSLNKSNPINWTTNLGWFGEFDGSIAVDPLSYPLVSAASCPSCRSLLRHLQSLLHNLFDLFLVLRCFSLSWFADT